MIIKRENKRNFTTLNNEVVEDSRLSYEALGLLAYLLSRPEDWEVHVDQLRTRTKIGRDKLYRIVGELQEAGYMEHERLRDRGEIKSGRWIVREQPILEQDSKVEAENEPHPEKPDEALEPRPEKPHLAEPHPANQDAYKDSTDTNSEQVQNERDAGAPAREAERPLPHHDLLARLIEKHPQAAHDDVEDTHKAWRALQPAERHEAVDRFDEWLGSAGARKAICGLPTYLKQKRWTLLAPKAAIAELASAWVDAFSRSWWWLYHDFVKRHGESLRDRQSAASVELARRVNFALNSAGFRQAIGWKINPDDRERIDESSKALRQVPKDGTEAKALAAHYQALGLTMPLPTVAQWIFIPDERLPIDEDLASVASQSLSR